MAASDRPTAATDRPKLMARAAVCSNLAGDASRYEELLDRARSLDPHNIQVVLAEVELTRFG